MRRTHEIRVREFLERHGGYGPTVKTEHQMARIRRRELSFDPLLMEKADWNNRLGVGGQFVPMGATE